MASNNGVVFFYPSRLVGGTEYLFIRLARELADIGIRVFYVDYSDGFARSQLSACRITFIDFEDGKKAVLSVNSTVITPASNFLRISDYLDIRDETAQLIFWFLHPYNIIHVMPESGVLTLLREEIIENFMKIFCKKNFYTAKSILENLNKSNSLWFMDGSNLNFNKNIFRINFEEKYVPVPYIQNNANIYANKESDNDEYINIAILGRLSYDKIYSVINVLDRLSEIDIDKKINAHLIGDGDAKHLIDCEKYNEKIRIFFHGTLIDKELNKFLLDNIDVLFAMGTSALVGASLGIPVVLLDYGFKPFINNKFLYLYNALDYSLGEHHSRIKSGAISMNMIIGDICCKSKRDEIGYFCQKHWRDNHSMKTTIDIVSEKIQEGSISFSDYSKLIKNVFFEKNRGFFYIMINKLIKKRIISI